MVSGVRASPVSHREWRSGGRHPDERVRCPLLCQSNGIRRNLLGDVWTDSAAGSLWRVHEQTTARTMGSPGTTVLGVQNESSIVGNFPIVHDVGVRHGRAKTEFLPPQAFRAHLRHHRRYRITEDSDEIQIQRVAGVMFGREAKRG